MYSNYASCSLAAAWRDWENRAAVIQISEIASSRCKPQIERKSHPRFQIETLCAHNQMQSRNAQKQFNEDNLIANCSDDNHIVTLNLFS